MKLTLIKESDVYNQNQKLKNMVENVLPQLQKMVVQKINSDDYNGAVELLNKIRMIASECSQQVKVFASQNSTKQDQIKISNREI